MFQLSYAYMTTGKNHSFDYTAFVDKMTSLLFKMLSTFVIAILPRSKHILISCLRSPSAVIFLAQENKIWHCFHYLHIYLPWSDRTGYHDLRFLNATSKQPFSCSSFALIKRLFSFSSLSAIKVVSHAYLRLLIFLPAVLIQLSISHDVFPL